MALVELEASGLRSATRHQTVRTLYGVSRCRVECARSILDRMVGPRPDPSIFEPGSAARQVLERIADRWTAMVVCALATGPKRYGELRRHIGGITHKMLAQTLRRMEAVGSCRGRSFLASCPVLSIGSPPSRAARARCRWRASRSPPVGRRRPAALRRSVARRPPLRLGLHREPLGELLEVDPRSALRWKKNSSPLAVMKPKPRSGCRLARNRALYRDPPPSRVVPSMPRRAQGMLLLGADPIRPSC